MYICNCNGLRCRDVNEALDRGARTPDQVHAHHGCRERCGRCRVEIVDRLRQHDMSAATVPA